MKKLLSIIFLLLVACMTFSACGGSIDTSAGTDSETDSETETNPETQEGTEEDEDMTKTYTMAEAAEYCRVLGRTKMSGDSLICDWSACGAEFAMDCVGDVQLTFTYGGGGGYLTVFVDDAFYKDIQLSSGVKTYTVAEDLEQGFHMIRIVTQYAKHKGSFDKIQVDGSLIKLPQSEAYVEIIGDSITCGAYLSPTGSDYATKSYAYIAMNKLDADYSICAKGGMPMSVPSSINSTYPYYNNDRDDSAYVPTRQADLIIVNLGTNDNWQWYSQAQNNVDHETFNYENFDAGVATFFENLDKIHGEKAVPILFVFGCTTNPKYTVGTDRLQELINNVYIPAGYDVQMAFLPTDRSGKDGHPSESGAKKQGEALAEYLKENYAEIFG